MNHKLKLFVCLMTLAIFCGCSGEDSAGCGKVKDVTFSANPTTVVLSYYAGDTTNSFRIEYGTAGFTQGTGTTVTTSGTQLEIVNLSPSTTYDFYITGICDVDNTGAAYKLASVTTAASQCTGNASVQIYQFYVDEVALEFSYDGGSADKYEVEYGLQGFTLGTGTRIATSGGSTSKVITGLQHATTYDYYVRAICWQSDASAFRKFSHTTMTSCPTPMNLNSYVISGSCSAGLGATRAFTWSNPAGTAQSYTISVISSIGASADTGNEFTTSNSSISLSGMYCMWKGFYVKANCADGESSSWAGPYYW